MVLLSSNDPLQPVEEQVSSHGRGPEDGPVADGTAEVEASTAASTAASPGWMKKGSL